MDFERILVPKDKRKKNLNESWTKKYEKHKACNYSCKLQCVRDKFSRPFESCLNEDDVYNLFTVWSKKVNIVVIWWKTFLTNNLRWLKKIIKIFRTLLKLDLG